MFGSRWFLVNGHMFIGCSLTTGALRVRVGEERIEPVLAAHPQGVTRRQSPTSGRVFSGSLAIEPEQYRGDAKLRPWFDLAMAHNATLEVGHMLKEGLCAGGKAPWHRVIGASGKSSLPAAAGGALQRSLLEEEGVEFRESGVVEPAAWWARTEPFYA